MHVYASYSINLAEMGSNRDEIQEIAARRAAEVRRRLAALARKAVEEEDAVVLVKAVAASDPDLPIDAYSPLETEQVLHAQARAQAEAAAQTVAQTPDPAGRLPAVRREASETRGVFSAVA